VPVEPEPVVPAAPELGLLRDSELVPEVGLLKLDLFELAPLQLGAIIRTALTRMRGVPLFSSTPLVAAVVPGADVLRLLLRARREDRAARGCGMSVPVTSTCWPSCPSSTPGPSSMKLFEPLVPVLLLTPLTLVPATPELVLGWLVMPLWPDTPDVDAAPADAPPLVMVAFVNM